MHKKSINAKDILDHPSQSQGKQKSYSFDFANREAYDIHCRQQQREKQGDGTGRGEGGAEGVEDRESSEWSFLAKIRVSGGRNRYKKDSNISNTTQGLTGLANQKQYNSLQIPKQANSSNPNEGSPQAQPPPANRSKDNYSPFYIMQNSRSQMNTLFNNNELKVKLHVKRSNRNRNHDKNRNKSSTNGNLSGDAKLLTQKTPKFQQLKTQFNKVKIFQKQQQELQQIINSKKLNPYQLSLRRKNINLIKMKLNSLGQQADQEEKSRCLELSRLCDQDEDRKRKRGVWRAKGLEDMKSNFEKNMEKWYRGYTSYHQQRQQQFHSSFKRSPQRNSTEALQIFDLKSKTIEIRQVPRSSIRHKEYKTIYNERHRSQEKDNTGTGINLRNSYKATPRDKQTINTRKRVKTTNYLTVID